LSSSVKARPLSRSRALACGAVTDWMTAVVLRELFALDTSAGATAGPGGTR